MTLCLGMWYHVVWQKFTDVLGKPCTAILRTEAALYYHEDQGSSLGDNPPLVPLLQPEIPHRMSWAKAGPFNFLICVSQNLVHCAV